MEVILDERTIERFNAKVKRGAPGECWDWQGAKMGNKGGEYGGFAIRKADRTWTSIQAHRVAFLIAFGKLPSQDGCHTCDNRKCCNPAHIVDESKRWNRMDCVAKGRQRNGPHQRGGRTLGTYGAWRQIPDEAIPVIKDRYRSGETQKAIGADYGVSGGYISHIVTGRRRATPSARGR